MQPKNVLPVLAVGDNFEYALFKIAITFAENGLHVWFISPAAFEKAPKNIKPPDKEILQLITFMYLKDHNDLVTQLNSIHLWRKIPNLIIISGYEHYCNLYTVDEYNPLQAALVTTSLLDSAAVCATRKNENIKLLVSCLKPTECDAPRLQTLRDLYFMDHVYKPNDHDFINKIMQVFK